MSRCETYFTDSPLLNVRRTRWLADRSSARDFVGRTDAKVHRKEELLEFKAIYLETPFWKNEDGSERLVTGLREFAEFLDCNEITIASTTPKSAKSVLTKKL